MAQRITRLPTEQKIAGSSPAKIANFLNFEINVYICSGHGLSISIHITAFKTSLDYKYKLKREEYYDVQYCIAKLNNTIYKILLCK